MVAPGFEGAAPAEIIGQVLGGDAVEAAEPLLEAAVIGVDVVDVQMGRLGGRFARRGDGVKGDAGFAGEGGDRPAAVADQMIGGRDNSGKRCAYGSPVDLRQNRVESRALPVAGDEDGNVVLIKAGMPGRSAALSKPFSAGSTSGL